MFYILIIQHAIYLQIMPQYYKQIGMRENQDTQDKYLGPLQNPETGFHECDIQKIMNGLYIGDQFASGNIKLLNDLNIKHIIVVGQQLKVCHPKHFNYLEIPVRDHRKENISQHFHKTNDFIQKALTTNQTVFVHCAKGKSRSATIILAYLMYKYKMQSQQALIYVKRKRREVSPNEGFLHQLKKYEEILGIVKTYQK